MCSAQLMPLVFVIQLSVFMDIILIKEKENSCYTETHVIIQWIQNSNCVK